MCGRFALGLSHDEIQEMHGYNVQIGEWVGRDQFVPRYNVAPRSQAPVIRRRGDGEGSSSAGSSSGQPGPSGHEGEDGKTVANGATQENERCTSATEETSLMMQTMRWGLVPHFSKHEDSSLKTINARCEALIEERGGMWASIKGKKRCAVVCQGYYEWLKKGKERLPHFTKHADGRLMLLAGLWDSVVLEGSRERLWTFTVVTTDACNELGWLHDRQPVILRDEHALALWLDTSAGKWTGELARLCRPYHYADAPLTCYQVPKDVGRPRSDSPSFVLPIALRKDGIEAMFAKQPSRRPTKRGLSPTSHSPDKKAKVAEVNASEDDSDIECIHSPLPHNSRKQSPSKPSPKVEKKPAKLSPRKLKAGTQSSHSTKITSFFAKK